MVFGDVRCAKRILKLLSGALCVAARAELFDMHVVEFLYNACIGAKRVYIDTLR